MAVKRSNSQFLMNSRLSKLHSATSTRLISHSPENSHLQAPKGQVRQLPSEETTVDFHLDEQNTQHGGILQISTNPDKRGYSPFSPQDCQILNLRLEHEIHNQTEDDYPSDFAFEFDNIHGCLPSCLCNLCTSHEAILTITEASIYQLMPRSNQIVILDSSMPLEKALEVLNFSNNSVVPLWNNDECIVYEIISTSKILTTFATKITEGLDLKPSLFLKKSLFEIFPYNREHRMITITSDYNVYDACQVLLDNGICFVPVIDKFTRSTLHILSLKNILSFLYSKVVSFDELPKFLLATIRQLDLCSKLNFDVLSSSDIILEAFKLFGSGISIIPIVSKTGLLINSINNTDGIKILTEFPELDLTCVLIQDVLSKESSLAKNILYCSLDDSLLDVISQFIRANTYWLVVIDNYGHHKGLVILSDILKYLFFGLRENAL